MHALTRRLSGQTTPLSNSDFMARFSELSINRQSMRDFTKKQFFKPTQGFPKRDSPFKNSHAFRSFVNSTINRPPQNEDTFLADFYAKIRMAVLKHSKKEIVDNKTRNRAITECSLTPYRPPRMKRLKTQTHPAKNP